MEAALAACVRKVKMSLLTREGLVLKIHDLEIKTFSLNHNHFFCEPFIFCIRFSTRLCADQQLLTKCAFGFKRLSLHAQRIFLVNRQELDKNLDLKYSRNVFHSAWSLLHLLSTAKTLWENWHWETLWQCKCWIPTSDDSAEKWTAIAVVLQWLSEVSFITIVMYPL